MKPLPVQVIKMTRTGQTIMYEDDRGRSLFQNDAGLVVHPGQTVEWQCGESFSITFTGDSPFRIKKLTGGDGQPASDIVGKDKKRADPYKFTATIGIPANLDSAVDDPRIFVN